jgi:hypothetical protein
MARNSRKICCSWVSRFLEVFCGSTAPDWSSLRGADLSGCVQNETSRLKQNGRTDIRQTKSVTRIRRGAATLPRLPWLLQATTKILPLLNFELANQQLETRLPGAQSKEDF